MPMSGIFIVAAVRTAVGKAPRGALSATRPDDLAAAAIRAAIDRLPQLDATQIDDVILGCAMPEGEQGLNVARIAAMRAGLPASASAMTVNRFCSSGLQAIALAADAIHAGRANVVVAGGTESMSMVPMEGNKFSANPWLVDHHPDVYLSMGLTAENVARKYGITREQADEFALASHHKALAAIQSGKFNEEIAPVATANGEFKTDEGPRADTSAGALAKLKPAFHAKGTVTAGNSSQTSDGAAAAILISEQRARELNIQPIARFVSFATAGVAPEIMGIGPVEAIPKALKLAGLTLDQIDLIELNEAFAAQALAVIQQAGLDPAKINVNGGAIALGHPLGCTGAKLTATILHELKRRKLRHGLVTMCVGGGMGAAGVVENLK
ncbi:MAG TPA: acetyl-CoA C-acyltransferase [Acidobacteriaceae bacterium]|nr:acetyl-CoA C-acyltransferase [Acidobacteriaceae bacterium]